MYSHHIKLFFIAISIMLTALLNGCSQPGYQAPLSSYNSETTENRKTEKKQPIKTAPAPTKKINSPPKNSFIPSYKKSQPNYISPYTQPKSTPPARKNGSNSQKKPIISTDNEIMLNLNFKWPIKGKIVKNFSQSANKGIDITGKLGQAVAASEAGKVVYSGQGLLGYGNLLIIKHNDLYLSAYANNSKLLVAEGHSVKKGQIIALVGQVGLNQASLHFEIRKNGIPVNPLSLLPGK
jgi:lipoprotein NlpD